MIRLEQLSKFYDESRVFAVRRVNLEIQAGEFLVLVGESGCGKTTTLKMIQPACRAFQWEDPHGALPPYDAVLLLAPAMAHRPDVVAALTPLLGTIAVQGCGKPTRW